MSKYREFIEIKPEIRFGKPVIKGTRISVGDVLSMLGSGMSENEIVLDFPNIKIEHIRACLEYASMKEKLIAFAV